MHAALHLAQQAAPAPDAGLGLLFPLLLGFAFVYFMIIRPQKREQDEREQMSSALKKNDRVLTSSGIHGVVVNLKDDEVTLRVDDQQKVKIRFARSAIAKVLGQDSESPSEPEPTKS